MLAVAASVGVLVVALAVGSARAQTRVESLERPGGQRVAGRLARRQPDGVRLHPLAVVRAACSRNRLGRPFQRVRPEFPGKPAAVPGLDRRIAATLAVLCAASPSRSVRLGLSWQSREVTHAPARRAGGRPAPRRVTSAGRRIRTLDASRWSITGKPELVAVAASHRQAQSAPARRRRDRSFINLSEPLATGRFDLAFLDDGAVVAGQQWSIELTFQGAAGLSLVRVVAGVVGGEPGGRVAERSGRATAGPDARLAPILAPVRPRADRGFRRRQGAGARQGAGWPAGRDPAGELAVGASRRRPKGLAGHFDDLQLIRFAEPPASLELDVTQDEARLVVGDQLYGTIRQADGERVSMTVDGEPISLPWSDVAGLYFRRVPATGARSRGSAGAGRVAFGAGRRSRQHRFRRRRDSLPFPTRPSPWPRPMPACCRSHASSCARLVVQGQGRRILIDPAAHHLGDEFSMTAPLDPPQPEGALLERTLELAEVPDRPCFLVLDVVQVVGENSGDPLFPASSRRRAENLRRGQRQAYRLPEPLYQNATIDAPERIAIPIPAGLLHPGKNTIRLELTGMATEEKQLDDLGVLQMAVEFRSTPRLVPQPPHEPGHP